MHWIIFWIKLQHDKGLKLGKNYFYKNVVLGFLKQKKKKKSQRDPILGVLSFMGMKTWNF